MTVAAKTPAERVDAAVARAGLSVVGKPLPEQLDVIMRAGFAAILAELPLRNDDGESDGDGAATLRELPTAPGSLILITAWSDPWAPTPLLAVRCHNGPDDPEAAYAWCTPGFWWTEASNGDSSGIWLDASTIRGWIPARADRDDEWGPVGALRRIATDRLEMPADEALDYLRKLAGTALVDVGGRDAAAVTT